MRDVYPVKYDKDEGFVTRILSITPRLDSMLFLLVDSTVLLCPW